MRFSILDHPKNFPDKKNHRSKLPIYAEVSDFWEIFLILPKDCISAK
jgi:hypothetical protein